MRNAHGDNRKGRASGTLLTASADWACWGRPSPSDSLYPAKKGPEVPTCIRGEHRLDHSSSRLRRIPIFATNSLSRSRGSSFAQILSHCGTRRSPIGQQIHSLGGATMHTDPSSEDMQSLFQRLRSRDGEAFGEICRRLWVELLVTARYRVRRAARARPGLRRGGRPGQYTEPDVDSIHGRPHGSPGRGRRILAIRAHHHRQTNRDEGAELGPPSSPHRPTRTPTADPDFRDITRPMTWIAGLLV